MQELLIEIENSEMCMQCFFRVVMFIIYRGSCRILSIDWDLGILFVIIHLWKLLCYFLTEILRFYFSKLLQNREHKWEVLDYCSYSLII